MSKSNCPEPPTEEPPVSGGKLATIVHTTKVVFVHIGRRALAAGGAVMRSFSTHAKRRHELKLAKMQAKANHLQALAAASSGPITFAPQIVQATVVKVKRTGSCGCSGCGVVLKKKKGSGLFSVGILANNFPEKLVGGTGGED